jgi:hypothetical protein
MTTIPSMVPAFGLFVDGDHIPASYVPFALSHASKVGGVPIRRIYGGSTALSTELWTAMISEYDLEIISQEPVSRLKNGTDIALVCDALNFFYCHHMTHFILVGRDSDYTPFVRRLRSLGAYILGIGPSSTPESLRESYSVFECSDQQSQLSHKNNHICSKIESALHYAYWQAREQEISEWVRLSLIGKSLRQVMPSFSITEYGCTRLLELFEASPHLFEINHPIQGECTVRLRQ